ncbi:sulfurtransferase complex subunit TusB [Thalassotalea sp. G2M2-11]|uniref:sulfurtransferase complex subunit TusB n=1 Tax=Thalassotalea sp. G2M2-11 TaxID=2787627 RepID=UPI0019D1E227|nr:sulfurtransferase complex subunit TusB [Thalassotalea sp. G2M2-11]
MSGNTLHILRSSPFADKQADLMVNYMSVNDSVVLIDDGCYLLHHHNLKKLLEKHTQLYAIESHVDARALESNQAVSLISLATLNALVFSHHNSVTWA